MKKLLWIGPIVLVILGGYMIAAGIGTGDLSFSLRGAFMATMAFVIKWYFLEEQL